MLDKILFPLGSFKDKQQIRDIAKRNNLNIANKPDSEDICFISNGNYSDFLLKNSDIKEKAGNIVTSNGRIIGNHNGLFKYTIGQRKGIGITNTVPLFVTGFNKEKNELLVGEKEELYKKELYATNLNILLFDKIDKPMKVKAKIRYSAKVEEAIVFPISKDKIKVKFMQEQRAITPGQSVVLYIDDIVLGGGKIIYN